jgi:hypothetical protein
MRVEDRIRRCVVFVGAENARGFTPYGTGFLVRSVYSEDHHYSVTVIVTAMHVIQDIPGDHVSIRINRKEGDASVIRVPKLSVIEFTKADIAIIRQNIDPTIYKISSIGINRKDWGEAAKFWTPGVGDEVSTIGLYTSHFGYLKNVPVARIGHIAALPDDTEKVMTHWGYVVGYLIEVHSLAGLSGSPVFVNIPSSEYIDGRLMSRMQGGQQLAHLPIGIFIGFHTIETKEDEMVVPQFQTAPEERKFGEPPKEVELRRTGFGVVIPIEVLLVFFESDTWREMMKQAVEIHIKESGARPASAKPSDAAPPAANPNPTHREDFERLLGKAAKPQKDE